MILCLDHGLRFGDNFCRIDEDESMRVEDKFQYLLSSLKSNTKARDIVESYPPSKENYSKVIEHLKSRFGRKDLLIEVYIRDLLALVNSKTNLKLSDLYDKLGPYLRALETLGVTTSNYAAMLHKDEPTAATLIANSAGKNKNVKNVRKSLT
ncbi:transposable element Tc1 transposase [Caerostris extrusa]|uniref:Transposable element Tc1 transposase n=1 Tax=Caerostris extrusa TaxID=172846 RepID=A0AAV4N1F7_CAEEX|nr:transposable element Tc1 transposase [Caerostris extrusa]